jgi:hypothetical protein
MGGVGAEHFVFGGGTVADGQSEDLENIEY